MKGDYKNRINMFDFSKGTAMLLILSTYTLGRYDFFRNSPALWFWMFIAYPGTAALFLVMGYWYKPKRTRQLLMELRGSALKLYAMTGLTAVIAALVFCWTDRAYIEQLGIRIPGIFLGYLFGYESSVMLGNVTVLEIGAMWYVLAYIVGILILNLIFSTGIQEKKKAVVPVFVFLLAVVGLILGNVSILPYCLPQVLVTIQTLYYGYVLRQNGMMNRKWNIKDWLILLLGCVGTIGIYYGVSLIIGGVEGMFNRAAMLFAVPAGIMLLRLGQFLQKTDVFLTNLISLIGSKSMVLMAIFAVENIAFNWNYIMISDIMPENEVVNALLILALRIVIYTGIVLLLPIINQKLGSLRLKRQDRMSKKPADSVEKEKKS